MPGAELGTVNGVQGSACAAFEVASFVAGLVLHRPPQFRALMAGSLAVVATSAVTLARYARSAAADAFSAAPSSEEQALAHDERESLLAADALDDAALLS